ncbi:hypothetical protein HDU83_002239 [Entophlyctis luteolus]|nr:hypothetical protein HDU83_002239 [Entophlyctis luteolus]KAJ3391157.1 hypothetical protein HDU84_006371 [Entophlyctis sp. JEL0112]
MDAPVAVAPTQECDEIARTGQALKRKRGDSSSSSEDSASYAASTDSGQVVPPPLSPQLPHHAHDHGAVNREHIQKSEKVESQPKRMWKNMYAERCVVERNWRKARFQRTVMKNCHADGVISMHFNDCKGKYVTGGNDNVIRVWDCETNNCIKELKGHTNAVSGVQFDDHKIVSCSFDRTIRIWCMRTFEVIRILDGFRDGVACVHYVDEILASGCVDGTIRITNTKAGKYFTLRGHTDWVNEVRIYNKRQLFSCSDDQTVRLWDLTTHTVVREFVGHHDQVLCLSVSLPMPRTARAGVESEGAAPRLVTGSLDKTLKVWDIDTGACLHTLFGHEEGVMCVASDTLRIVSGSTANTVFVWDLESGEKMHAMGRTPDVAVQDEEGGNGVVACIQLSDTRVMTGSDDGSVATYDFYPNDLFQASV